eukprot:TRINITY_DN4798_c0_g1_i2.p1 TRINITY_DN4798_c0_g1~~TRINITY_DN4798_c0_g1_i2.p1  ORF type:complete len:442 (-),score=59.70 TRINITY_DN4798_c0_g1_i2:190-1515(-)
MVLLRVAHLGLLPWFLGELACVSGFCERKMGVQNDSDVLGGKCPLDHPRFGRIWRTYAQRFSEEGALLNMVATGQPLSKELGEVTTLNTLPVSNSTIEGKALDLVLTMTVLRVSEISQRDQMYKMHYILKWYWRDCRVLSRCDTLSVYDTNDLFSSFWRPPVRITEREHDELSMKVQHHVLYGYGWHSFIEEHVSKFRCRFEFAELPFDSHRCRLTFSLPGVPNSSIRLLWYQGDPNVAPVEGEKLKSSAWEIDQVPDWKIGTSDEQFYDLDKKKTISRLVVTFNIKRAPAVMASYITFAFLFFLLNWIGLWIDPAAVPARAAFGIIPILVIANMMNSLDATLPPMGYSTRLSSFLSMTLSMMVLHVLAYAAVHHASRLHKRILEEKKRKEDLVQEEGVPVKTGEPYSWKIITFLHLRLETHLRWMSLLIYFVAGFVTMFA